MIAAFEISYEEEFSNGYPSLSSGVEEREIHTSSGEVAGRERWGYLGAYRWRYLRFLNMSKAGYLAVAPNVANEYDRILNSACFVSETKARK